MKKTKDNSASFHYYATTAFGWSVAATREEAIAGCARYAGNDLIKRNALIGGLYCWSCRVGLPQSAHYTISEYMPRRVTVDGKVTEEVVPLSRIVTVRIQNMKGHVIIEDKNGS